MKKLYEVEKDWITAAGLRAVVTVDRHRCGYVGVPVGHVLHGVEYNADVPAFREMLKDAIVGQKSPIIVFCFDGSKASPEYIFDVHGGLTYSGGGGEYPVTSDLHWFGFDCGHAGDAPVVDIGFGVHLCGTVRTLDFCVTQCEDLAKQIVEKCANTTVPPPPSRR